MALGVGSSVPDVRVDLLGPVRVTGDQGETTFNAAKERSLLAALALRPGTVVSADWLVDVLWGDRPPASARKTLQTYISALRRELGADKLRTEAGGYALRMSASDVDVVRFRQLVRTAAETIGRGDSGRARQLLGEAVALVRAEPLSGVSLHADLAGEAVRLKEELISAVEARVEADLGCGGHEAVVAELESLVVEHPYRERLWGQLMLALSRSGRQRDALAAYQRARQVLADELGLEPGGGLRRLESAILAGDHWTLEPRPVGSDDGSAEAVLVRSPVRSPSPTTACMSPSRLSVTVRSTCWSSRDGSAISTSGGTHQPTT